MTDIFKNYVLPIPNMVLVDIQQENQKTENLANELNLPIAQKLEPVNFNDIPIINYPVSLGQDSFYCESKLYTNTAQEYFISRDYSLGNEIPEDIEDSFRFVSQKYWTGDIPYFANTRFAGSLSVPFDIYLGPEEYSSDKSSKLTMKLVNRKRNGLEKPHAWRAYIKGAEEETFSIQGRGEIKIAKTQSIIPQGTFYDFAFVDPPVHNMSDGKTQNIFDFQCNYDFYIKNYEDVLSSVELNENLIPNLYTITVENSKELSADNKIHKFNTLNNRIADEVRAVSGSTITGLNQVYNLLDQWSRKVLTLTSEERQIFVKQNKNLIFSLDELEGNLLKEIETVSNLYPIKIKVNLDLRENSEVSEVIKNARSDKSILNKIVDSSILYETGATSSETLPSGEIVTLRNPSLIRKMDFISFNPKRQDYADLSIKSWDFARLLGRNYQSQDELKTSLDTYNPTFTETFDAAFSGVYPLILKLNIDNMIDKYDRTFEEILLGKPCFSNIVAYKISKFEVNRANRIDVNNPLQNYYFSNSLELDKFLLNDTQVKYGKTYRYIVYSYKLVFGNSYSYEIKAPAIIGQPQVVNLNAGLNTPPENQARPVTPLGIENENKQEIGSVSLVIPKRIDPGPKVVDAVDSDMANIEISKKPELKLFEIPIFESENIKVRDSAPIPPDMKFDTYINDSTSLNISLERMFGEYKETPIQILRTDEKFIFRMSDENGLVDYKGDDSIEYFELYRTKNAPINYQSFGEPYRLIKTSTAENELARTPEVTILDKLDENEKYYYFSRAIDVHNNLSNPSFVYEVEIVSNSGAIYPIIRVYNFPEPIKKNFKDVNKYIRIYPSYNQTLINGEERGIRNLKLGSSDSIWSKRFKFRFTSYNSGKKIDIDVRFKYYVKGYLFELTSGGTAFVADSFTEALSLLLLEQNIELM